VPYVSNSKIMGAFEHSIVLGILCHFMLQFYAKLYFTCAALVQ